MKLKLKVKNTKKTITKYKPENFLKTLTKISNLFKLLEHWSF